MVEKAIRLKDDDDGYSQNKDIGDEVWCVFDRDFKPEPNNQQNFNQAIILAYNNNINLAISNDAFELWFLLHFDYYNSTTNRNAFEKKLTQKLGKKYEKNDSSIYEILERRSTTAIKNAENLWNSHDKQVDLCTDELDKLIKKHNINPSTTVYQLVARLVKYLD